jgi:serine/threonine-protein kinase
VGTLATGMPYMVMEYLEGGDLAARLAQVHRLPLPEIARYVLEACEALAEAHAAGIVHRDLKPANLFLARRPDHTSSVKLLDFGISKAPVGAAGGITSTQAIMGSPVYMSPEQLVSAKNVDARSDIWSLGVVLYEALAGAPPFTGESMPQIVTRILHTPAPRLLETRPDLPPAVDAIVARCLEKDPVRRFVDVAELAAAMAPFAPDAARSVERVARVLGRPERGPTSVLPSTPPPSLHAPMAMQPPSPLSPSARPPASADAWGTTQAHTPKRSAATWVVLGVLAMCAVLGVGGVVALRRIQARAQAEAARAAASILAPATGPSASASEPVTLAPPPSAVATADVSAPPPSSAPAAAATTPPWRRGRPQPAPTPTPVATNGSTAQPAPVPTPAPAPTADDPLHMGIK